MSAKNKYFKYIFSFESGEQVIYEDSASNVRLLDKYYSPFLIAPEGNCAMDECDRSLQLITNADITPTEYREFQAFCTSITKQQEQPDKISNVLVISSDGEVFYDISAQEIAGLRFGGHSNDGVLCFNLEIYFNKGE